jgi:hypothetical protein
MPFRLRLTVGRKLALSFAVLGVFLLLVIAAGLSGMRLPCARPRGC